MKTRLLFVTLVVAVGWPASTARPSERTWLPIHYGTWNPHVGSGAIYQIEVHGRQCEVRIAVTGSEQTSSGTGYWIDSLTRCHEEDKPSVRLQTLEVADGETLLVKRAIRTVGKEKPKEIRTGLPRLMSGGELEKMRDIRNRGKFVATEEIETPAGTIISDHYRFGKAEIWFSSKVVPYSVVKAVLPRDTMMLIQLLDDTNQSLCLQELRP